jgi:hypothetical protein
MKDRRVLAFGLFLILDFLLTLVMLATDKNLQTDFGAHPAYYVHWYAGLGEAIIDLLAGLAVIAYVAVPSFQRMSLRQRKGAVYGAFVWTILVILASVGVVETYQQVGFASANDFAQYLFQGTTYPYTQPYIPWLYDVILVFYLVTAVLGILSVLKIRSAWTASPAPSPV